MKYKMSGGIKNKLQQQAICADRVAWPFFKFENIWTLIMNINTNIKHKIKSIFGQVNLKIANFKDKEKKFKLSKKDRIIKQQ